MDDIMSDQLRIRIGKQMTHVIFGPREEIIETDHIRAFFQQEIAEVAAKEGPLQR